VNTSRTRKTLVVPVILLAMTGLAACGADEFADTSTADTTTSAGSDDAGADTETATLALTADGSTAGKCAVPSAEALATFDTAFAGTVTSIEGGTATLSVDEWYAGAGADTVTVDTPSDDLQDLLMAVDFQEGQTYLVSAQDDRVTLCGFSAEKTPELEALYAEAFSA
jgi:hypothetical protein